MDSIATTAKCNRCGRTLRSAKSIAAGYGRTCQAKIAAAAKTADLAEFRPFQVAKAAELIELGGIVRANRPALYLAVSSRGDVTYEVDQAAHVCSCPAGEKGVPCYHLAAAAILRAA